MTDYLEHNIRNVVQELTEANKKLMIQGSLFAKDSQTYDNEKQMNIEL
jgi:hypothetical protein